MKLIREITGYKTSTDYMKLYELAKKQSVICLCDSECRLDEIKCIK